MADACIMADAPNAPVAGGYPLAISEHNNNAHNNEKATLK